MKRVRRRFATLVTQTLCVLLLATGPVNEICDVLPKATIGFALLLTPREF